MPTADVRAMQAQGIREVIVARNAGMTAAEQATLRAQAGVSYVRPGPLPNTEVDQAPAGRLTAAVAALESNAQVQYAEPNGEVQATSTPNDPYFGVQWGLSNTGQTITANHVSLSGTAGDDIGATSAWTRSTGAGVTVGVVDTGVDSTAPDLAGQIVAGASFSGGAQGTSTQDQSGHGTHVSGIIAALQNNGIGVSGVAPEAKVMPLQALNANGSGNFVDVANAFNYAGQHNIRIVNASLGARTTSQTLEQAIQDNPNTLFVVAAGNTSTDDDNPATPFYPCGLSEDNVICVGATNQSDQPASFTNRGATSVDLFAPGTNIVSTWMSDASGQPQYAYASGTSMAAPMVTGTLALMLAENPSLTPAQLKADLLATVTPEPQLAGLSVTGGELNAGAAVAAAAPLPPAPSAPPPAPAAQAPITVTPPATAPAVSLSHVAVRGGGRRASLVFTLSAQARVQITFSGALRGRLATAQVLRTWVRGHRGANRYTLTSLLHGRRLQRGRYTLTVRAGGRTVVVHLRVA
jgi:subtilisin family serine protease